MTGDQPDMLARLKGLLPPSWFGAGETPILDAALQGPAWALAFFYSLYDYAKLQTRILTATDGWLDLIAYDFFGPGIRRAANQSDGSFRATIIASLFRERATRAAVSKVVEALTGNAPVIIEPGRMIDTGAFDQPFWAYDTAGSWAEPSLAYQAFVQVLLPAVSGIPYVAGWDVAVGAYDTASAIEWTDSSMVQAAVTAQDVSAAITSVRPVATRLWVQFSYPRNYVVLTTEDGRTILTEDGRPLAA